MVTQRAGLPTPQNRKVRKRGLLAIAWIPLCLSSVTSCSGNDRHADDRRLAEREVRALQLVRVDSLVLALPEGQVQGITAFRRYKGGYLVLDGFAAKVHVFDAQGQHVLTFGGKGDGPGEFRDPMDIDRFHDSLLVLDPARGGVLHTLTPDGEWVATERLPLPHPAFGIQVGGEEIFVMTYGPRTPEQESQEGADILWILDKNLEIVGRGCPMEAGYMESYARNGRVGRTLLGAFNVLDSLVYCIQSISPAVVILNRNNHEFRRVVAVPPFYRGPVDEPFTLNQKAVFAFLATWTAHRSIYGLEGGSGFVSVYSQFNEQDGGFRYWILRCDLDAMLAVRGCGATETRQQPVLVTPDGKVYLEEDVRPDQSPVIGIYRMTRRASSR